jgi:nucleoside-diphosphate kinase
MPGSDRPVSRQRTLVIVKPDGVRRGLIGAVIHDFEQKGLALDAITTLTADPAQIRENYRANEDEPWFEEMVQYMCSGPIVPMAWSGPNAIESGRQLIGDKDPWESDGGTLRGKYAADPIRTVVHGSRDPVEALREINLWFPDLLGQEKAAPLPEIKTVMGVVTKVLTRPPLVLAEYAARSER